MVPFGGAHSMFPLSNAISSTIIISHFNVNLDIPLPNTMISQQGGEADPKIRISSRKAFLCESEFATLSTARGAGSKHASRYLP